MSTVTLDADLSNTEQFVESMFNNRGYSGILSDIENGKHNSGFANSTSQGRVLNSWLAAWQASQGDTQTYSHYQTVDYDLIAFLAGYIKNNNLYLCTPDLTYLGVEKGTHKAVYQNNGYQRKSFLTDNEWNYGVVNSDGSLSLGSYPDDTVANFLKHLYFGSHFVVISSAQDTNQSVDFFYEKFQHSSGLTISWDKVNSHYSASTWVNTSGLYYLNITSDSEPSTNPLIAAFLAGRTGDSGYSNTFFQLEGWQSHFPYVGGWHAADYDQHEDTIWNYSTFGACCYSEKRSTPIFLAPDDFDLSLDPYTQMPLYNGAGSVQDWMNTDLIRI